MRKKKIQMRCFFSYHFGAHCNKKTKDTKMRSKRMKLHQSKYNLMIKSEEEVKYKTDDEEMGECMR